MKDWLYRHSHDEIVWRTWFWILDWLRLIEGLVGVLTFSFWRPTLYGRFFDFLLDKCWL